MEDDTVINRRAAFAGTFYPAGRQSLENVVKEHFSSAGPGNSLQNIKAVIAPHAGYIYSGTVAASAFSQLDHNHTYDNVFLIGSSHHVSFNGAAIYTTGNFETPFGTATVNRDLAREIVNNYPDVFTNDPSPHEGEHSLEVQVPFLQYIYNDRLNLVPIVIATQSAATIKKIADALEPYFNANNLFVISTDFSHYPNYENAIKIDGITADAILKNSADEFLTTLHENSEKRIQNLATSVCGWTSVLTLMYLSQDIKGAQYHEVLYRNSGDADAGNRQRVVGYHAIALTVDPIIDSGGYLSENEKKTLLQLARVTIESYLDNGKVTDAGSSTGLTEKLREPAGAFVTLTKNGKLRGCIGQFSRDIPLYRVVQEMAVSAATRDYRFSQVRNEELKSIHIEISILTPMNRVASIEEIIPGKHGIYIKKGNQTGTFLPRVALQTGWNAEELVKHCAVDKAGISVDELKDAEIYVYEAYVFSEK